MLRMLETFKGLAPDQDLDSFKIGYYSRQDDIDILQQENINLKSNKKSFEKKKIIMESLERLFNSLVEHENSGCSSCVFCENQWKIIDMIQEKLDEFKKD